MKWFTTPALLAAAVFSAAVVIPFLPAAKEQPNIFVLEARVASPIAGLIKVYYDIGAGYNETDASEQILNASPEPQTYRFPLPMARYRSLRFDPINGPGKVIIDGPLQITSESGRVIRKLNFSDLVSLHQIESRREVNGRLEVTPVPYANDPQLGVAFSTALTLEVTATEVVESLFTRAWRVFAALLILLWLLDRLTGVPNAVVKTGLWLKARPRRAVLLVAAAAVTLSAYPVVFMGKSFVSPNFGTTLLYEAHPTLPGYTSGVTSSPNGSDVGAALWQHVPYSFMQRRALAHGEMPLWNRYTLTGTPLLAQAQSMFGDPLHFFVILFDGASWAWDLKYLVSKWLFAAGLGWLVLAIVGHRPSAWIVTLAAPFVGFYLYRINHAAIFAVGYAPWVLYSWVQLGQAVGRRAGALWLGGLFLSNFALMNSGAAKEAYLLLLQMNLAGAVVVLVGRGSWAVKGVKCAGAAWAGALLLLITAPLWTTFLQALRAAYTVSSNPAADQIQPSLLLGAFDEIFFRPLSRGEVVFNPALNLLLLLGVLYFLATLRQHFADRTVMALAIVAAGLLAVVFGLVPPFWIWKVPLLATVGHIENCCLCGLLVLLPVLAGCGFRTAAARLRTPEGRGDLVIGAVLLVALVAAWIGFRQAAHRAVFGPGTIISVVPSGQVIPVRPFIWGYLAALMVACGALAIMARRGLRGASWGAGSVIMATTCAVVLLWRHGMHSPALGFENYILQPPARANFQATSPAIEFVLAKHRAEPGRVYGLHGNVTPGWNARYGLEAIHGADGLQNKWVRNLIDVSPVKWTSSWRLYLASTDVGKARPFLDMLNVRHYLDLPGNPPVSGPALSLVKNADLNVYESASAWPRAFFTDAVTTYEQPADLMAKILAGDGRPLAAIQVGEWAANPALTRLPTDMAARNIIPATHYELAENSTSFDVHATSPGLVVLEEAWWPDMFKVAISGRAAPILRVNHAFRGVLIEAAGDFRVTFFYWPRKFTRSLILSAVGAGLLGLSLVIALRPYRPR